MQITRLIPSDISRNIGFVSSSKYQLALAEAEKRLEELFLLDVTASVSTTEATKIKPEVDRDTNILTEVIIRGATAFTHQRYPITGIPDTETTPVSMAELLDNFVDKTGMPEHFDEFNIQQKGRVIQNSEYAAIENEILQSENILYEYQKARGRTQWGIAENITGFTMFPVPTVFRELHNVLHTPVSGRRMKSIEVTEFISGERHGWKNLPLEQLQQNLVRQKYEFWHGNLIYEDYGIYNPVMSRLINGVRGQGRGAAYILWLRDSQDLVSPIIPVYEE